MKQEDRLTLTDWSINGQAEIYQYLSSIPQYNIRHHQTLCSCVRRTAEYEDTGLSPAEVEVLKHRADVAEEALRLAIKRADISYFKCNYTKLCNFRTYECGSEECINIIMEAYKQEVEARLKKIGGRR